MSSTGDPEAVRSPPADGAARCIGGGRLESGFDPALARERVESAFRQVDPVGRIAAECWQDYSTKLATVTRLKSRLQSVVEQWWTHEPELRALVRPSTVIASHFGCSTPPNTATPPSPFPIRSLPPVRPDVPPRKPRRSRRQHRPVD